MSSDTDLLARWRFMAAIVEDRALSDLDRRVAFLLLWRFNEARGYAWPSYQGIADDLGSSKRSVIRSTERLVAGGWFTSQPGGRGKGGRGYATRFCPVWERVTAATPFNGERVTSGAQKGCHPEHERVTPESPQTIYETVYRNGEEEDAHARAPDGAALAVSGVVEVITPFEAFWSAYPRKEHRSAAERAWVELLGKGTVDAETLIAAAEAYAAAAADRQPRFIKFPENWLRQDGWLDDPQPPKPSTSTSTGRRLSVAETAAKVFGNSPEAEARRNFYRGKI